MDLLHTEQLILYHTSTTPGDHRSITQTCGKCSERSLNLLHIWQLMLHESSYRGCDLPSVLLSYGVKITEGRLVICLGLCVVCRLQKTRGYDLVRAWASVSHPQVAAFPRTPRIHHPGLQQMHGEKLRSAAHSSADEKLRFAAQSSADPVPHCCRHRPR